MCSDLKLVFHRAEQYHYEMVDLCEVVRLRQQAIKCDQCVVVSEDMWDKYRPGFPQEAC